MLISSISPGAPNAVTVPPGARRPATFRSPPRVEEAFIHACTRSEPAAGAIAQELVELTETLRQRLQEDPFGNPVLASSLTIFRMMDAGTLDMDGTAALIADLRDTAFAARAARLAAYIGGSDPERAAQAMTALATRLATADGASWEEFRNLVERIRFAAVFTAHPTFSLPRAVAADLAARRLRRARHQLRQPSAEQADARRGVRRRPCIAIRHGRDALDMLNRSAARARTRGVAGPLDARWSRARSC